MDLWCVWWGGDGGGGGDVSLEVINAYTNYTAYKLHDRFIKPVKNIKMMSFIMYSKDDYRLY